MIKVAELLGIGTPETVRTWVHHVEVEDGARPGRAGEESAEVKRLKRENAGLKWENAGLKRANGIWKAAAAFFGAELDRPSR